MLEAIIYMASQQMPLFIVSDFMVFQIFTKAKRKNAKKSNKNMVLAAFLQHEYYPPHKQKTCHLCVKAILKQ